MTAAAQRATLSVVDEDAELYERWETLEAKKAGG